MEVVEFMGMPNAGKTTHIDRMLDSDEIVTHRIPSSREYCPLPEDDYFAYNSWIANRTLNNIIETYPEEDADIVLVERGVYDRRAFSRAHYRAGDITREELDATLDYLDQFTYFEDSVVAWIVEPSTSLERHPEPGSVVNTDFLQDLHASYEETLPEVEHELLVIDGEDPLESNGKELEEFLCG